MRNYCTLSDIRYLHYGLALHDSLLRHSEPFILYYLCLDSETYEKLSDLGVPEIVPISLEEIMEQRKELKKASTLAPSYEALNVAQQTNADATQLQFFWSLTPYFTWYIFNSKDLDNILYIDSDIYFFSSLEPIFREVKNKSIGIVRHRTPYNAAVGEFNVGIVYFKNTLKGHQCLDWWKECLLNPKNEFYSSHGMCGDQKYLELFPALFGDENVCVIDDTVGHIAPWNFAYQTYDNEGLTWRDKKQPLTYSHFSNFKPDYEKNTYEIAPRHGIAGDDVGVNLINNAYDEYYIITAKMKRSI